MGFFRHECSSVLPSSRGSSQPRDQSTISYNSCIADDFLPLSHQGRPKQLNIHQIGVQFSSVAQSCLTLCDSMNRSMRFLSITNSQSSLRLTSIESVMPSSHLILCCPLLIPPSVFPSIKVFSNESVLHIRWPKYSISPSNEHSGLISFRANLFDLLAVPGTQESSPTPQFRSINSSALSFLYGLTLTSIRDYWKTIALTRWIFVGRVMSLLF